MEAGDVVQRGDRHPHQQHRPIREGSPAPPPLSRKRRLVLTQRCVSGSGHRRPGRDHLRDVQRGEEGLLPLGGVRPQQAAVRRLQTSSEDVRQQEPRWQVSGGGGR